MTKFSKLLAYSKKTFKFSKFVSEFSRKRRCKQFADAPVLMSMVTGLMSGLDSLNSLSNSPGAKFSRSVMEDFLKVEGLPRRLRRYVASLVKKMKRGKMINLENVKGKVIASVDGVETYRRSFSVEEFKKHVEAGLLDSHCQVSVHRDSKTKAIASFSVYHRLVVVCVITDRGPMPMAWRYQESQAHEQYKNWLLNGADNLKIPSCENDSADKLKQEGELTTLKKILHDISKDFPRQFPFEVLIGDSLYDKSSVLCEVEKYGVALVSVHKDKRRLTRQEAEEDFLTQNPSKTWAENKKEYQGWIKTLKDKNIDRLNQKVKIARVIRRQGGSCIDNYFYCSDRDFITPRFVEWCRHYRWKEENGFNAWTNSWNLLKHVFHHTHAACESMIGLIFMSIIFVENFRHGNLKRGKSKKCTTLKMFFREIAASIFIQNRSEFFKFSIDYATA